MKRLRLNWLWFLVLLGIRLELLIAVNLQGNSLLGKKLTCIFIKILD